MTPLQIIEDALMEIGVLQSMESPTAEEAQDALRVFNDMLTSGEMWGQNLNHTTAVLTDTLPYPDNHRLAFVRLLAVYLAPQYGRQPSPMLLGAAEKASRMLQNYYLKIQPMQTDDALNPYYTANRYYQESL